MFHQQHSLSVMLQKLKVVAVSKILWSFKNRLIKSLSNISNQKPLVKTTPLWFYYYSFHAHLNFSVLPNANNKFKFYLYNMGDNIMWSAIKVYSRFPVIHIFSECFIFDNKANWVCMVCSQQYALPHFLKHL